jgi:ABC-type nitrate/sulfonate/bicarbonate transport system substrate-binding protein
MVEKPEDLRGRRVGTPGYGMSSHTWIRGFLQDVYGVKPADMQWIETAKSSDGGKLNAGFAKYFLPQDFPLKRGPEGVDESELLISGDVDALITAIEPKAFTEGNPKIRRLFPNVQVLSSSCVTLTSRAWPNANFAWKRSFTHPHWIWSRRKIHRPPSVNDPCVWHILRRLSGLGGQQLSCEVHWASGIRL